MHVTITYIRRYDILKHSLQLLVMGPALSFSLFQELTPVASPTAVSSRSSQLRSEAGKKSRVCLSVLDITIFQIGETRMHFRGTTNYLFKLPGGLVESEGTQRNASRAKELSRATILDNDNFWPVKLLRLLLAKVFGHTTNLSIQHCIFEVWEVGSQYQGNPTYFQRNSGW